MWTQTQTRVKARTVQRRGLSPRVAYVSAAAVLDAEEKVTDEVSSDKNMRFDSFRLSRNTQRCLEQKEDGLICLCIRSLNTNTDAGR